MNVPKLRFKEFTDEYSSYKLKDKCEIYDGTHETPKYTSNGVKFVSVEDIKNLLNSNKYISKDDFEKYKIKPRINDIFMTRIGDIGTSAILNKEIPLAYYVSLSLIRCKNKTLNASYLNQYISCYIFQKELNNKTIHVAFPKKINTGEIGESNIIIPNDTKEQTKIANFLSLLDKKIELQTKKIEDLKLYKLSLLNHLLKKYDTKKIILKDICKIYAGGTPSTSNEKYWNGNIKWIQSGLIQNCLIKRDDIKNAITELGLNNSSTKMIKPNTTLLAMTGATCGNTAFLECEACANQSVMAFETTKVNSKFIYYLFQNNKKYILKFQAGGAQSGINKSSCESLEFDFPNIELQNKIVKILDYCEEQLSNNILKLSKLQKLKKGLMQNMFV